MLSNTSVKPFTFYASEVLIDYVQRPEGILTRKTNASITLIMYSHIFSTSVSRADINLLGIILPTDNLP